MERRTDIIRKHQNNIENIQMSFVSYRCFGDEKLKKPALLKGLSPIKQFELMRKKVDVYDLGNGDLVLYFGTLFSKPASFPDKEDMALPTSVLAKKYNLSKGKFKSFIYPDAWCTIYNRNEGYISANGLKECFKDLFCINVASISERVYLCLRELSTKDSGFLRLGIIPVDRDSMEYYRLCEDLVHWLYIMERNKVDFYKN